MSKNSALTSRSSRRGFTLVELTLGLVVTAFVAGGVGAFLLAVSRCWHETADVQTGTVRASQFTARLAKRIQDAKRVGYWRDGSGNDGGLIFWQGDTNSDGDMQLSEIGVVRFNAVNQTVDLCTLAVGQPDGIWTTDDLKDPGAIENFVPYSTSTPLIRGVETAMLTVRNAQSEITAPIVMWILAFRQPDGTLSSQSCVVSVRGAATPP